MAFERLKLGIIGGGSIACGLLELLSRNGKAEAVTILVRGGRSSPRSDTLRPLLERAARTWRIVDTAKEVAQTASVVVEAAGHGALAEHAETVLHQGVTLVPVSTGALMDDALRSRLYRSAEENNAQIVIPGGAIGAIDMIGAMAEGQPDLVIAYTGTKPPTAWLTAPDMNAAQLLSAQRPLILFEGSAREAALRFPQNANVAATVALAIGDPERVRVSLVADPAAAGNRHKLEISGVSGRLFFEVETASAPGKPGTSQTTAQSVMRTLRRMQTSVSI